MTRSTKAVAVTAAAVAAIAGLAGCGSKALSPQQALDNSFSGLAGSSSLTVTVKLPVSSSDLAYFNSIDDTDDAATKARIAKLVPTSSVVFTTATADGKSLKSLAGNAKDENVSFAFLFGGKPDVEIRSIGKTQTLYAHADVNDLVTQGGGNLSDITSALSQVPASLGFVKTAAAGGWLNIDLGSLEALAKQFPGATGAAGIPTPNPTQAAAAEAQLVDSLERDVTATQGAASSLGNHLVLTANSKAVVTDVVDAIMTVVPAALKTQVDKELKLSNVPSTTVSLDAYTKNGTLSALRIDLAQFASGTDATKIKGHHIPLEIDFSTAAAKVVAPSTSTNVNLQDLFQAFSGLATGGSSRETTAPATALGTTSFPTSLPYPTAAP